MENEQIHNVNETPSNEQPQNPQNGDMRPRPKKRRSNGKKNKIDFRYQPQGSESSLATQLDQMGLREATLDALSKGGIKTARDLAIRKERDLYRIQNIGKKNIVDVQRALERLGLSFRPEEAQSGGGVQQISAREKLERSLKGKGEQSENAFPDKKERNADRRNGAKEDNNSFKNRKNNASNANDKNRNERRETGGFDNGRKPQPQNREKSAKAKEREKELERARRFADFKRILYTEPPQVKTPPERGQLVRICKNSKWGFVDKKGMEIVSPVYDEVFNFHEGMAGVEKNGAIGYVNEAGEEIIAPKYECGLSFSEGLASVTLNSKCGYIDKQGEVVIDFIYDAATSFSEGVAKVRQSGKWGTLQKDGSVEWMK